MREILEDLNSQYDICNTRNSMEGVLSISKLHTWYFSLSACVGPVSCFIAAGVRYFAKAILGVGVGA